MALRNSIAATIMGMTVVATGICNANNKIPDNVDTDWSWEVFDPFPEWLGPNGTADVGPPFWADNKTLEIPNQNLEDHHKKLWVEVEYTVLPTPLPSVILKREAFGGDPASDDARLPSVDGTTATWFWPLAHCPEEETIVFPDTSFHDLTNIEHVRVASTCIAIVPEPTTSALALTALCLAMSRRRAF